MSFLKGVTDIFRGDDDDDDVDESGLEEQEEEETSKPKRLGAKERSSGCAKSAGHTRTGVRKNC